MALDTAKRCIFCDGASGTSLSKEHVFPAWLRRVFPRSPTDTHTHGTVSWIDLAQGGLAPVTNQRQRQGQASTRKVRVVCEQCNNGWLSAMEVRTKPLLLGLMQGERIELGPEEYLLLATWAAKTIMTAEFIDGSRIAIPPQARHALMQCLCPPPQGWWIWIAGYAGTEWITGIYHFVTRLNRSEADLKTPDTLNLQSTTIGLGHLVIHAISTSIPDLSFALGNPGASDLKAIWPLSATSISWPPLRLLADDDVNLIKQNVERAFGVPTSLDMVRPS